MGEFLVEELHSSRWTEGYVLQDAAVGLGWGVVKEKEKENEKGKNAVMQSFGQGAGCRGHQGFK